MSHLLQRCESCNRYSLGVLCPVCGSPTRNPHHPKYSPEDKLARFRRIQKYGQPIV